MNYYSEQDIRSIVEKVLSEDGLTVPVEVSARHVHLTKEALEALFGQGCSLTPKRDLSQPGQFLSEERIKLATPKGELSNVSILGPLRKEVQVEMSLTDARTLGLQIPVRLSGDLSGAADVVLIGPRGVYHAKGAVIAAKAHIHMTPEDAARFGVSHGERVSLKLMTSRPATLEDVSIRVSDKFRLAAHIDFDEANAAAASGEIRGMLYKGR